MSVMLRSAYIHWSPDLCQLEYRCVFCALVFNTHIECLAHVVEPCGMSPQQGVPKTGSYLQITRFSMCLEFFWVQSKNGFQTAFTMATLWQSWPQTGAFPALNPSS